MTSKTPRTGNQYSIHHGGYSAVICELGAKIRRFDFNGKEIFCPFGVNDLTPTCNGYVLAPWPNRIENGEYDFNGKHYCAPVNEYHPAPRNNANHGYAYHYMWKLESLTDSAVTLSLRFPNLDGYPFDSAACHLQIKAASHVTVNEALIPTGTEPVAGIYDLNDGPTLEGRAFDDAWVDVERAADGTTTTTFTRPDGIEVKLIGDETINAWQCYTATGAPFAEHPYGIAVEPMTAPANAFRTGNHLVTLAPESDYTTVVRYEVAQK